MKTRKIQFTIILSIFLFAPIIHAQQDVPKMHISIMEVMQKVITPATDTLWAANPTSDEDWLDLEAAAYTTITAATLTGIGGTGPKDATWVKEPIYQAFNAAMTAAGVSALEAIQAKDMKALFVAGDALYSPCEGCHLQFNPGVLEQ